MYVGMVFYIHIKYHFNCFSVVGPISCAAKLQLNMKPEADNFQIPKALLKIDLENVLISELFLFKI